MALVKPLYFSPYNTAAGVIKQDEICYRKIYRRNIVETFSLRPVYTFSKIAEKKLTENGNVFTETSLNVFVKTLTCFKSFRHVFLQRSRFFVWFFRKRSEFFQIFFIHLCTDLFKIICSHVFAYER